MNSMAAGVALLAALALPHGPDAADIVEDPFPLEQAAVARTVRDVWEAAEQGDGDRLEALHLYGLKFSKFDDVPPTGRQDAAAARANERMALSRLKAFKATVEELKVDVLGSVAVATFILRYSFETPDASGSASARSTMVLVHRDGSWRIIHEHFSRLAEAE